MDLKRETQAEIKESKSPKTAAGGSGSSGGFVDQVLRLVEQLTPQELEELEKLMNQLKLEQAQRNAGMDSERGGVDSLDSDDAMRD